MLPILRRLRASRLNGNRDRGWVALHGNGPETIAAFAVTLAQTVVLEELVAERAPLRREQGKAALFRTGAEVLLHHVARDNCASLQSRLRGARTRRRRAVDQGRDHLVREAAQGKQGDGGVRVRGEADAARADHAEGADHHTRETRIQHRHLEVFHEEGAEIATENAPDIRRQERQPGEQRDFLDVHAAHG